MKQKRFLTYMKHIDNGYVAVKKVKVKGNPEQVEYNGNAFPFDSSRASYQTSKAIFYHVDIDFGQVWLQKESLEVDPKLTDAILRKHLAQQLAGGLRKKSQLDKDWVLMGLCIGLGFGIGFIVEVVAKVGMS